MKITNLVLCPECGSDYLRVCIYPPAISKYNTAIMARVECAVCKFCGPIAPPGQETVEGAAETWNKFVVNWKRDV